MNMKWFPHKLFFWNWIVNNMLGQYTCVTNKQCATDHLEFIFIRENMPIRLVFSDYETVTCHTSKFWWIVISTETKSILTKSSNISLWWTWIVIRVSYLVLSTGSRSLVVMSIRVLSISRKYWLVLAMIRRSCRALDKASSESRVHMIWMPNNPTLKMFWVFFDRRGETRKQSTHFEWPRIFAIWYLILMMEF